MLAYVPHSSIAAVSPFGVLGLCCGVFFVVLLFFLNSLCRLLKAVIIFPLLMDLCYGRNLLISRAPLVLHCSVAMFDPIKRNHMKSCFLLSEGERKPSFGSEEKLRLAKYMEHDVVNKTS